MLIVIDVREDQVDRWGYLYFAARPNPQFDPKQQPSDTNPMYLIKFDEAMSMPGYECRAVKGKNVITLTVMPTPPEAASEEPDTDGAEQASNG